MSHKILLFTHKPLDTSDKGVQVQSYQNLINEGFKILQTRIITGFSDLSLIHILQLGIDNQDKVRTHLSSIASWKQFHSCYQKESKQKI